MTHGTDDLQGQSHNIFEGDSKVNVFYTSQSNLKMGLRGIDDIHIYSRHIVYVFCEQLNFQFQICFEAEPLFRS